MSNTEPDLEYRNYLETFETPQLYEMLLEIRPDVEVDAKNRNRVMRILEKIHDGDDFDVHNQPRYTCLKLGVTWERSILRARIDERLERRLKQGMIDEVKGLMDRGVSTEFLMKLGLEYRFITQYLIGEFPSQEEMVDKLATAIKQFAKRQMIWFRRDPDIQWIDMANNPSQQAIEKIDRFLAE